MRPRTRTLTRMLAVALLAVCLEATTLQQLSMTEMITQSTAIVRARVTGSYAASRGSDIYTYYQLSVLENLKSTLPSAATVAVPGGALRGLRQMVAGAPELHAGQEYVLFLWTSPSGLTQVIGLSQGLFNVKPGADGETVLFRSAATEPMLDAKGNLVRDQAVNMRLEDLRGRVRRSEASK